MTARDTVVFCMWVVVIVSALAIGASYVGRDLALPGAVGVAVVASAVLTATRRVAERSTRLPSQPPAAETGRRPFRRLFWLRERLIRGARSGEDFRLSVVPLLAELADDRLRRRHAIDRRRDERRARTLIGDELADLLAGAPTATAPSNAQIARYLDRIERL